MCSCVSATLAQVIIVMLVPVLTHEDLLRVQMWLETKLATVKYAPNIYVLFLAARMRAAQLTQDKTEKSNVPQPWVLVRMCSFAFATLAQVTIVMLVPVCTNEDDAPGA